MLSSSAAPPASAVVHYRLHLPDGQVVSSEQTGRPFTFELRNEQTLPGIEDAVRRMQPGQQVTLDLDPDEAFGYHDPEQVIAVDSHALQGHQVQPGQPLQVRLGSDVVQGYFRGTRGHEAIIDLNHPLAGMPMRVDLTLVSRS